jgi:hypothetical protein
LTFALVLFLVTLPALLLQVKSSYLIPSLLLLIEIPLVLITLLKRSPNKLQSIFPMVLILLLLMSLFARDRAVERNFHSETDSGLITKLIQENCDGCVIIAFTATSYSAMAYPTDSTPINVGYTDIQSHQELTQMALDDTVIVIKDRLDAWSNVPSQVDAANSLIRDYNCPGRELKGVEIFVCVLR